MAFESYEVCKGFAEACKKLGTHVVHGIEVPYNPASVRNVLKGRQRSEKLLELVAEKAPELFEGYPCAEEVKGWWEARRANKA